MQNYIFAIDRQEPAAAGRLIKSAGLGALIVSQADQAVIAAAAKHNLDLYLCFGAFSLGREFTSRSYWAQDYAKRPQRWFDSACPNELAVSGHRLAEAASLAARGAFKGVIVDGARFASPASASSFSAFLSCFCPRCANKAKSYGLDFSRMQKSVHDLALFLQGDRTKSRLGLAGLADWLEFRALSLADYFAEYIRVLRQAKSDLELGAFIFADSLAGLVGQTAAATSKLDLVCPMLYRRYQPSEQAAACLNHEWADLLAALTENTGLSPQQALEWLEPLASLATDQLAGQLTASSLRQDGFLPRHLYHETKNLLEKKGWPQVCPIIQLADQRLLESKAAVLAAGADSFGLFLYQQELLPYLAGLSGQA